MVPHVFRILLRGMFALLESSDGKVRFEELIYDSWNSIFVFVFVHVAKRKHRDGNIFIFFFFSSKNTYS